MVAVHTVSTDSGVATRMQTRECPRGCGYTGRPNHVAWHARACLIPRSVDRLAEIGHAVRMGECLVWMGRPNDRGRIGKPQRRPYVVAYEIEHGPAPAGLYICHHCDVPGCFEPKHLYAGTPNQNMRDASARHRLGGFAAWDHETRMAKGAVQHLAKARAVLVVERAKRRAARIACGFPMPRGGTCSLRLDHLGHHKAGDQ